MLKFQGFTRRIFLKNSSQLAKEGKRFPSKDNAAENIYLETKWSEIKALINLALGSSNVSKRKLIGRDKFSKLLLCFFNGLGVEHIKRE